MPHVDPYNQNVIVNPLPAAPAPEPGCTSNSQCGDKEICRDRSCINPCIAANPCAPNAICSVRAHSVSCNCPSGYTGDSFSNCYIPLMVHLDFKPHKMNLLALLQHLEVHMRYLLLFLNQIVSQKSVKTFSPTFTCLQRFFWV